MNAYIGVDVGTGQCSSRSFRRSRPDAWSGKPPIEMWRPRPDFVEQSSEDIWAACRAAVAGAMARAGISSEVVRGIGFDATCSLVVLDGDDKPISVDPDGDDTRNVVVWMDHRAIPQAQRINADRHAVLDYVGGRISPEMETPKLLWLKENLPETWRRAARFFDLPDFLTYRATGVNTRSLCSTVCKWTYLGHEGRWDEAYWRSIGLGDIADKGFACVGTKVRPMGEAIGTGLSEQAARDLGLNPGTAVGVSIIDAHAGGLGMLGTELDGHSPSAQDMECRLALIGGTSSCHMAVVARGMFRARCLGPLLFSDGSGHVALGGRTIGNRRPDRPRDRNPSTGFRSDGRGRSDKPDRLSDS